MCVQVRSVCVGFQLAYEQLLLLTITISIYKSTYLKIRGLTAIFSSVTQTQTRTQLARVLLEYESSGIKLSVSGV